jgi:hypothetical protein
MFLVIINMLSGNIVCYLISNCANKISIFLKLTSPQLFLQFGMPLKYMPRGFTFLYFHYFRIRKQWWKTQKYMNMILCYFHHLYFRFIADGNLPKAIFYTFSNITYQYPFSVLWSLFQMISGIIGRMSASPYGHIINVSVFVTEEKTRNGKLFSKKTNYEISFLQRLIVI